MSQIWLATVPNNKDHPDKTYAAIQSVMTASSYSKMSRVDVPNLVVGTLDTLMSLADDMTKIGTIVENVVRKVERQYLEIAGPKADALRVHEVTVEAYLQRFQWDYAQYQHQGRKLHELVSQIQSMTAKVDEDLKTLTTSYTDKSLALQATKRKKVVNYITSDLEDFLTPRDIAKIDVLDTENLKTLLVAIPLAQEQEFLEKYTSIGAGIAAFGGPDWRSTNVKIGENDGNFGPALERAAVTGSPVVPGSALKIASEIDQVLYAMTVLKGHYQAGVVVDGVFNPGNFVDYIEPLKAAFREKRFTIREIEYDVNKAGGVDAAITQGEAEMTQVRNAALRWCRAHFGEVYSGYMHLKVIQAFVESVLRYGLPVDFITFLVEPNMKIEKEVQKRLNKVVLQLRPELAMKALHIEEDEEEDADSHDTLPYVSLKLPVIGATST